MNLYCSVQMTQPFLRSLTVFGCTAPMCTTSRMMAMQALRDRRPRKRDLLAAAQSKMVRAAGTKATSCFSLGTAACLLTGCCIPGGFMMQEGEGEKISKSELKRRQKQAEKVIVAEGVLSLATSPVVPPTCWLGPVHALHSRQPCAHRAVSQSWAPWFFVGGDVGGEWREARMHCASVHACPSDLCPSTVRISFL